MYSWAIDEEILEQSPMVRIPKPTKEERARDRILEKDEMALLWRAFDKLDPSMALGLKTLLLTGQRPGEVLGMRWDELFDLRAPARARWELSPERVKNGRRHVVPIVPAVLEIIEGTNRSSDEPFVFASSRNRSASFDRQSVARALKRLIRGLEPSPQEETTVSRLQKSEPTPHDFRRTAITGMMSLGISREIVKSVVNHAEGDITEAHYDRYDRMPEKRRALEIWAKSVLETVASGGIRRPDDNVLPMSNSFATKVTS